MKKFSHKENLAGVGKLGGWFAATRVINLFCMVIVTRALLPSDFTVIAAVSAMQGLIWKFSSFNLYAELVRAKSVDPEDLRTAWSYETGRNLLLASLFFLAAPLLAALIERPETTPVFRISSMGLVIAAFNNPRLLELRRERRFGVLGGLESISPIVYGATAAIVVQWQQDYWALVWAGIAAVTCYAIVPYFIKPWRPGFNFSWRRVKPMFRLGIVGQLTSVFAATKEHGLVIILVFYGLQEDIGLYNRAAAFSLAISMKLLGLIWKVSYPSFAQAEREGKSSLAIAIKYQNYLLMAGIGSGIVAIPLGAWLLPSVIGSQWTEMIPTWIYLAVASCLLIAASPVDAAFTASRNEVRGLRIYFSTSVLQLVAGLVTVGLFGLEGSGMAVLIASVAALLLGRFFANQLKYEDTEPVVEIPETEPTVTST